MCWGNIEIEDGCGKIWLIILNIIRWRDVASGVHIDHCVSLTDFLKICCPKYSDGLKQSLDATPI